MKVAKFGGTSLASAEQITKVAQIVKEDPERRIIVVSAPGKRFKEDSKVTDLLIACAENQLAMGNPGPAFDAVIQRFQEIRTDLDLPQAVVDDIRQDLQQRLQSDGSDRGRFMDTVKAAGEDYSAQIVAQAFVKLGIEGAHYVNPREIGLLLSDEPGNARVLPESYDNLKVLRDEPGVVVFPGFFGRTRSGAVATFPRGGSDITGSILARAVGAEEYENFTDVDSVGVVDPRIVPHAKPIECLTYREMRELSYTGFSVFNDEALEPVAQVGVPVRIRNTNNPQAPGTRIVGERECSPGVVAGVAADREFCTIFVRKYLMNRERGIGRKLLEIVEEEGLSWEHAPSGIDDISVILREAEFTDVVEERVKQRIIAELNPDDVTVERGFGLVVIVGEGMRHTVGITARAAKALAGAGVNIEMINQGSSEISIVFGVMQERCDDAVRALYYEFFGD